MKNGILAVLILTMFHHFSIKGQQRETGPVIEDFGEFYHIPSPEFATDTTRALKVVFDVKNSPEDPDARNPWIETAARFLNMHARAGVPVDRLEVALVVHNQATPDLLTDTYYRERFGTDNPNSGLLEALTEAGAQVILCGQSSAARNVPPEHAVPGVKRALSAMTALIQLQDEGFRLIAF